MNNDGLELASLSDLKNKIKQQTSNLQSEVLGFNQNAQALLSSENRGSSANRNVPVYQAQDDFLGLQGNTETLESNPANVRRNLTKY